MTLDDLTRCDVVIGPCEVRVMISQREARVYAVTARGTGCAVTASGTGYAVTARGTGCDADRCDQDSVFVRNAVDCEIHAVRPARPPARGGVSMLAP